MTLTLDEMRAKLAAGRAASGRPVLCDRCGGPLHGFLMGRVQRRFLIRDIPEHATCARECRLCWLLSFNSMGFNGKEAPHPIRLNVREEWRGCEDEANAWAATISVSAIRREIPEARGTAEQCALMRLSAPGYVLNPHQHAFDFSVDNEDSQALLAIAERDARARHHHVDPGQKTWTDAEMFAAARAVADETEQEWEGDPFASWLARGSPQNRRFLRGTFLGMPVIEDGDIREWRDFNRVNAAAWSHEDGLRFIEQVRNLDRAR